MDVINRCVRRDPMAEVENVRMSGKPLKNLIDPLVQSSTTNDQPHRIHVALDRGFRIDQLTRGVRRDLESFLVRKITGSTPTYSNSVIDSSPCPCNARPIRSM